MPSPPRPTPVHLSEYTSDLLRELRIHEKKAMADQPPPLNPDGTVTVTLTPEELARFRRVEDLNRLEAELRAQKAAHAALAAEDRELKMKTLFRKLLSSCVPFKIGGRDGHRASEEVHLAWDSETGFDIVVCEYGPRESPRQVAWVPVPLYPVGKPGRPFINQYTGESVPTMDLGESSISESNAEAWVYVPDLDSQGLLKKRVVRLKGFARISLDPRTITETERIRERRDAKEQFELVSDVSDLDRELDTAAHGGAAMDERPFIPSESGRKSRDSRPDSPSAPFSLDGDQR